MASLFGGGSSGGGGASGSWGPSIVTSSPSQPTPQKKPEQKKPEASSQKGWIDVGGGGNLFNDIFIGGTMQTRGGGFTPEGSYSAGFHGIGPPAAPGFLTAIENRGGIQDLNLDNPSDRELYRKMLSEQSITLSLPQKRGEYNRNIIAQGLPASFLIPIRGEDFADYINGKYRGPVQDLLNPWDPGYNYTGPAFNPRIGGTKPPPEEEPQSALIQAQSLFSNIMTPTPTGGSPLVLTPEVMSGLTISSPARPYTPTYGSSAKTPNAFQSALSSFSNIIENTKDLFKPFFSTLPSGSKTTAPTPTPVPTQTPTQAPKSTPTPSPALVSKATPSPTPTPVPNRVGESVAEVLPQNYSETAKKNVPVLIEAMKQQGMTNPNEIAYGIATAAHESGLELSKDEVRANPAYQPKLYNTQSNYEGGWQYHGRGPIQLTGLTNYKDYGQAIGLGDQLVENPDLANQPDVAARIFAEYLKRSGTAEEANKGNFYGARQYVNRYDYDTYGPIAYQAELIKNRLIQ